METQDPKGLTAEEKAAGWRLLFDGNSTRGWHSYGRSAAGAAWKVTGGTLHLDPSAKSDAAAGGDIVTDKSFTNFELRLEWKIARGGNSGIMFYVQEDSARYPYAWHTGPEMQVLDNEGHADGKFTSHRAGDLYDLIAAKEAARPVGDWNEVAIIADRGRLQFLMNGMEILRTTLWDSQWQRLIAQSKFRDMPGFGSFRSGRIALQDHGDPVWFRNIRIREL